MSQKGVMGKSVPNFNTGHTLVRPLEMSQKGSWGNLFPNFNNIHPQAKYCKKKANRSPQRPVTCLTGKSLVLQKKRAIAITGKLHLKVLNQNDFNH